MQVMRWVVGYWGRMKYKEVVVAKNKLVEVLKFYILVVGRELEEVVVHRLVEEEGDMMVLLEPLLFLVLYTI